MVGKTHQFLRGSLLAAAGLTGLIGPLNGRAAAPLAARGTQAEKESHWNVVGRSVEDRVIEYRQFGQGERQVLVVGPLDGDTTAALALVELLGDHLEQFPRRISGLRVTLVRDPNPDGRLRRSPYNARGVRLDQNFPTRNWHKVPSGANWLSGREPESEPETRVLVDLIDDVRPDRVIVLGATHRQAELTYFGPAEDLARDFAKAGSLRPAAANAAGQQGSLAVYTGDDRKTPTLVLRVPAAMRPDQAWVTYKRALLAAIGGEADDPAPKGSANDAASRQLSPQTTATLATVKGTSKDERPRLQGTPAPRVLTADELQPGGELVPVVRPPAAGSPAANYQQNGRPRRQNAFPPAALFHPKPATRKTLSPTAAGANPTTPAPPKRVDRLPQVDAASPPPKTLPQPIPLYPETGY